MFYATIMSMKQTKEEMAQKAHLRYLRNKEHKIAKREEWRKNHPEEWNARIRKYRAKHPERTRQVAKEWYYANKEHVLVHLKIKRDNIRSEMIAAYGGKCACCGELNPRFLTLDHINGGGNTERVGLGWSGSSIANHLKRKGWPQAGYQLLCFNCNCGRAYNNGICPHKTNPLA